MDARSRGYDHAAVHYTSDEEWLAVAVPFLLEAADAGEPALVSLEPERAELLRTALPRSSDVTFLVNNDIYVRPAAAIKEYRAMMAGFVAAGARDIRIFGEVPKAAIATAWDWWVRYEAAVNHAYDEFPLRSMCAYDVRTTPRHILDDVARTHPFVATPDGWHHASGRYLDPPAFLATPRPIAPHPIQLTAPLVELTDPTPSAVRRAVRDVNPTTLPGSEIDDFLLSVTEIVANAQCHGKPPVTVTVWGDSEHMVVVVHDTGSGPTDPFAGLLPAANPDIGRHHAGFGLWLAHQMCSHVALHRDADGFTVRLTAGNPHHNRC
ncbi:anti-sigma factor RsbA family regulatory protein [Actinophytocola sp. KF-1]